MRELDTLRQRRTAADPSNSNADNDNGKMLCYPSPTPSLTSSSRESSFSDERSSNSSDNGKYPVTNVTREHKTDEPGPYIEGFEHISKNSSGDTSKSSKSQSRSATPLNAPEKSLLYERLQKRCFSPKSSLPWGHKPHGLIGCSCLLFMLPVPLLVRSCFLTSASLLATVTITSYLSDHVYTGLNSWWHAIDRTVAPCALSSAMYAGYCVGGWEWSLSACFAVACHFRAHRCAKMELYEEFVIWHSLWHLMGVALIVVCFGRYGEVGECWRGSSWGECLGWTTHN